MLPTAALLALAVSAPAPRGPSIPDYVVVQGWCLATNPVGRSRLVVESEFVLADPGQEPDVDRGPRVTLQYLDRDVPYVSDDGARLRLPRFWAGDRAYLVAARGPGGSLTAVSDKEVLRRDVLGISPERLIHKLQDKEAAVGALALPDEAATRELARVVGRGLRLTTPGQRAHLGREEGGHEVPAVRTYLDWLGKRGRASPGVGR